MFLLFQSWQHELRTGSIKFTFQYVSIISLLPTAWAPTACSFTFQYVSIISIASKRFTEVHDEFTFQYVSIISLIVPAGNSFTAIYIPICFYYFEKLVTGKIYKSGIYIPICFYYFRLFFRLSFRQSHLHSNMFLLFLLKRDGNEESPYIYIPICFYYFLHWLLTIYAMNGIYIPICFYYFC